MSMLCSSWFMPLPEILKKLKSAPLLTQNVLSMNRNPVSTPDSVSKILCSATAGNDVILM